MNIFIGLFAALLALNGILALPAKSPNDDAEVISVPRRPIPGYEDGVIDTGAGYPFLQPNPQTFSLNFGFFDAFDDILRRFRERLWPIGVGNDPTEIGSRGSFDLDSKNANTTSTVKVVNGHKVEINETVYGDDDSNMFRVRIVNIRPLETGEDVEETVRTNTDSEKPTKTNTVTTTAPEKDRENEEDSDETREPLERDNEIRSLNEQKNSESSNLPVPKTALVEKTPTEDNRSDILNGTFVTDNSFEETENRNGNIEAETNKPTENKMLEKYDETNAVTASEASDAEQAETETMTDAAIVEEAQTNSPIDAIAEAAEATEDVISSAGVANVHAATLTIENNEKTETNDNFNESSEDASDAATAVEITKDLSKLTLNENARIEQEENTSSTLELNGEVLVPVTSAIETSSIENFQNDENHGDGVGDDVVGGIAENIEVARATHENLMAKAREDYSSSSDDEDIEPIQMSAAYNSEWGNLVQELKDANDQNNDLSNDIDIYESVPVDLSNDIAVNDIAAAQVDFPINPDAEFIDINGVINNSNSMPKFEKLSVSTSFQPETIEMHPTK